MIHFRTNALATSQSIEGYSNPVSLVHFVFLWLTSSSKLFVFVGILAAGILRLEGIGLVLQLLQHTDLRAIVGLNNRIFYEPK